MKKVLLLCLVLLGVCGSAMAANYGDVHVQPYQRNDGTTVPSHYRTQPDGVRENNYSHSGNTSPNESSRNTFNNGNSNSLGNNGGYPVFGNEGGRSSGNKSPFSR